MATGIPFPEANTVLRAPTPEDAAAGTVYDLHIHRYRDLDGQSNVISKWQFAPAELADIVASGGAFWFNCWGETHPPIWITGHSPFVRAGQGDAPAAEPEEHPNALDYRNRAERAEAECSELRALVAELTADKERMDYLDRCNAALNAAHGTYYGWKLILNHNVNRLMLDHFCVDLNDSQPHGLPSCRDAIDERMRAASPSPAASPGEGGQG